MAKIGVIGSGNGTNFEAIQHAITNGQLTAEIVCVISDNEDAGILTRAQKLDVPSRFISAAPFKSKLDGDAEATYIHYLQDCQVDYVVLAGFMRMIKPGLLNAFPNRIINIHPSLLPAFPGLDAWKQAFDYGVKVSGCTVHFVDEGMDTGKIISQRAVKVLPEDTAETLHQRIQEQEHLAYVEALQSVLESDT